MKVNPSSSVWMLWRNWRNRTQNYFELWYTRPILIFFVSANQANKIIETVPNYRQKKNDHRAVGIINKNASVTLPKKANFYIPQWRLKNRWPDMLACREGCWACEAAFFLGVLRHRTNKQSDLLAWDVQLKIPQIMWRAKWLSPFRGIIFERNRWEGKAGWTVCDDSENDAAPLTYQQDELLWQMYVCWHIKRAWMNMTTFSNRPGRPLSTSRGSCWARPSGGGLGAEDWPGWW